MTDTPDDIDRILARAPVRPLPEPRRWPSGAWLGPAILAALLFWAAVAALLLWPRPADAQPRACAPRAAVLERLAEGYGETRQAIGLGANNAIVETFANPETGSWTITATTARGITCLVASGMAWELTPSWVAQRGAPL